MAGYVLQSIAVTSTPGFVLESIAAETPAMTLVTDIDAGNVSASLSSITDPESSSPVVFIDHRAGASRASVPGWRHLYFAVENAEGKTPLFKLSRASRQYDTTPPTAWIPMMTTDPDDYTSWVQAPSRSLVTGSPNTIEFQFADPLPAGRVYISTHIVGGVAQMGALVDDLLTNHASIASILSSAGAGGVYATSPAETDDISRAVGGQPQYAVKLAFGGSTNDGGPKRKLVLGTHIHGAGEAASWGAFRYMLDYIMSSADAEAVALRANWDLYIYGPICPNALYGGASRWGWRSAEDPNRDWPDTSFYDELTATKAAILIDTGGAADAMLVWHTWGSATSLFNYGANTQDQDPETRHPAADAFLTLGATIFGSSPQSISAATDNTGSWWGRAALGAAVSFEAEIGMAAVTAPATQQHIGESWAKTLHAVDSDGLFWSPAPADLAAVGVSLATGSAGLVANISISASGLAQAAGSAGLSADVLLAGSGAALAAGNAALAAELSLLATGAAEASGSAALTGGAGGDLSAVGGAVATGAAALTLTVSLSGDGGALAGGAGALVATVSVAAAGSAVASGVAVLDGGAGGDLAGSGGAVASGSAQVVATVALTAAGFVQAMGAGALAVQVPLSATGGAVASGAGALVSGDVLLLISNPRWRITSPNRRWEIT